MNNILDHLQSLSRGRNGGAREIGDLAQHGQAEEDIGHLGAWRGVQGVVDKVGHKCGKSPVVATVLEQVGQRHCAMAEPAVEAFVLLERTDGVRLCGLLCQCLSICHGACMSR